MFDLSVSELLFYGGIVIIVISILMMIVFAVIFSYTGRKIKKKLEQEYGRGKTQQPDLN